MPTKEEYEAFDKVRRSGKYNMITEAIEASNEANLSIDLYKLVLLNYEGCMLKYS